MERKIKNLELKKSGNFCEFLSSKFNRICFIFSLYSELWFRLVRVRYTLYFPFLSSFDMELVELGGYNPLGLKKSLYQVSNINMRQNMAERSREWELL